MTNQLWRTVCGTAAVCVVLWCAYQANGLQRWLLLGSATVCQLAIVPLSLQKTSQKPGRTNLAQTAETTPESPVSQQDDLEVLKQEFIQREQQLQNRERSLTDRWLRYRELFENESASEHDVGVREFDFQHDPKISDKDRAVHQLLEEESRRIYENVRQNAYTVNDSFELKLLTQDVVEVLTRVAQVYSPETEQPLLETSISQLARAVSRMALHLLIVLEQLPVDVKDYNINSMHGWVRKAARSYGAYKTAAPWMSWLSRTAYVGRFVAGANPLTLGAWWAATEIGKRGAGLVVEKTIDRQAIALFHDLIRVVGFEFAGIYGGDFRHRDANWIYGTELTALVSRFPPSHKLLSTALSQVAELPLRNEYDRIYLYRLLAARKQAQPMLADSAMLDRSEREQLTRQIENVYRKFVHGQNETVVESWKEEFEARLDIRLRITSGEQSTSEREDTRLAVDSLISFALLNEEQQDTQLIQTLRSGKLWQRLNSDADRDSLTESVSNALAQSGTDVTFHPPAIDPDGPLVPEFLDDMVLLATHNGVCPEMIEQLVVETGAFFRVESELVRERFDQRYDQMLRRSLDESSPRAHVDGPSMRGILEALGTGTSVAFIYPDATAASPGAASASGYLIGIENDRRIQLQFFAEGRSIWKDEDDVVATRDRGMVIDDCVLTGGTWSAGFSGNIRVPGLLTSRFATYFAPLIKACRVDSTS